MERKMKNMKGRIFRKLKTISTRNPGLVFQANTPVQAFQTSNSNKDVKEEQLAFGPNAADSEENVVPCVRSKEVILHASELKPTETGAVSTRDQVQLSADKDTSLKIGSPACPSSIAKTESISNSIPLQCLKLECTEEHINDERVGHKYKLSLISDFEDRCPPGGRDSVVLYTTSLRGIRKTFEDCSAIRFLLESFRVMYSERDVSMHLEYREELWKILGGRVAPPRLFIRGRYIGGADEVVGLHEKGMLQNLFRGIPLSPSRNPCRGCGGMRFVLCCSCDGSRKVMPEGLNNGTPIRCPDCNENGLVKCSICN